MARSAGTYRYVLHTNLPPSSSVALGRQKLNFGPASRDKVPRPPQMAVSATTTSVGGHEPLRREQEGDLRTPNRKNPPAARNDCGTRPEPRKATARAPAPGPWHKAEAKEATAGGKPADTQKPWNAEPAQSHGTCPPRTGHPDAGVDPKTPAPSPKAECAPGLSPQGGT